MADVTHELGMVEQFRLIAGLRWRLLHNTLRRKNSRLDLIGLVIVGVFAAAFVLAVSIAFFSGAYHFVSNDGFLWLDLQFWAIFLWWQVFPIFLAGFGANFEFRSLLRFPLKLGTFYVIGLSYGLADFGAFAGLCWVASLTAGAALAMPKLMPEVITVAWTFVLLNVTLERLVGSWVERLLAKRRAREIFFAIFILLIASLQLIGPLMKRYGTTAGPMMIGLLPVISVLPPSLAGKALENAVIGDFRGSLTGAAEILVYAAIFGCLLWLRVAAQYRGEDISDTPATPAARAKRNSIPSNALELVSPQVAAIVRKEFRYLFRNRFAVLLLFVPPFLIFVLIWQAPWARSNIGSAEVFFPGLMAYLVLILMSPAYNSLAYEGPGIQAYFTAPIRFREIFLAKNFVQVTLLASELILCIAAFTYRVGLPAPPVFVATLAAIIFTVIGQLSLANWSSLSFPRKLEFGRIHGQRQSGMAVLVAFAAQILLFGISSVVLLLGRWTGDRWLPAEAFAFLSIAAVAGYLASLNALGNLAERKKEGIIEALCR